MRKLPGLAKRGFHLAPVIFARPAGAECCQLIEHSPQARRLLLRRDFAALQVAARAFASVKRDSADASMVVIMDRSTAFAHHPFSQDGAHARHPKAGRVLGRMRPTEPEYPLPY
jgi:hypothetical protein